MSSTVRTLTSEGRIISSKTFPLGVGGQGLIPTDPKFAVVDYATMNVGSIPCTPESRAKIVEEENVTHLSRSSFSIKGKGKLVVEGNFGEDLGLKVRRVEILRTNSS